MNLTTVLCLLLACFFIFIDDAHGAKLHNMEILRSKLKSQNYRVGAVYIGDNNDTDDMYAPDGNDDEAIMNEHNQRIYGGDTNNGTYDPESNGGGGDSTIGSDLRIVGGDKKNDTYGPGGSGGGDIMSVLESVNSNKNDSDAKGNGGNGHTKHNGSIDGGDGYPRIPNLSGNQMNFILLKLETELERLKAKRKFPFNSVQG